MDNFKCDIGQSVGCIMGNKRNFGPAKIRLF